MAPAGRRSKIVFSSVQAGAIHWAAQVAVFLTLSPPKKCLRIPTPLLLRALVRIPTPYRAHKEKRPSTLPILTGGIPMIRPIPLAAMDRTLTQSAAARPVEIVHSAPLTPIPSKTSGSALHETEATMAIGNVHGLRCSKWIPPIGFVWKSYSSTSPAEIYDGTSWSRIKDRAIMAAGNTFSLGATGGSREVTLTTAQIPGHSHNGSTSSDGAHTHTASTGAIGGDSYYLSKEENVVKTKTITTSYAGEHTHTVTVGSSGGGQSFSILNPYSTVFMWERIG